MLFASASPLASDYSPTIHAPEAQDPDNPTEEYQKGYRLICTFPQPDSVKPYYIVLLLRKGPDPDHCEEIVDIGDPVIQGEWVNVLATYNPTGGEIEWEHSPSDPGWTGEPPFKPQAVGEHTITARYYAEPGEPERDLVGYVEDKVTFTVLQKDAVHLISEVPKDTLLVGERMPLVARVVKVNADGESEPIAINPSITWDAWPDEGSSGEGKASNWRQLWHDAPPPEPGHTEWWFVGTLAGLSEGKVKVRATVWYYLEGDYDAVIMSGPEHEVEVRGFVDLRLDDVGEWGEEDPGAFMAKDGIEQLMLRTCTAGNVVLSWNSDKVGPFTDPACEQQHKGAEVVLPQHGEGPGTVPPKYSHPRCDKRLDTVGRFLRH